MLNRNLVKSLTDLRADPAGISKLAQEEGPVYIFNRNKPISVVLDVEAYEELMDRVQDALDVEEIKEMQKTAKPEDFVSWDEIKKDLKL